MELKAPLGVQLELTPQCNHKCTYCYNYWREDDLPTNKFIQQTYDLNHFVAIVNKLAKAEIFELTLTGGEPFLRKDIIFELIPRIQDVGIDVNINTNATLLNRDDMRKLKTEGINGLLTSFCSCDEDLFAKITNNESSYVRYIENIKALVDEGFGISSNMVVMQENKHLVYATGKFLYDLGVKGFSATPMVLSAYHKDASLAPKKADVVNILYDLVKLHEDLGMRIDVLEAIPKCIIPDDLKKRHYSFLDRACAAGRTTASVSMEGDVRPCSHSSHTYGNILTEDFETLWEKMRCWRNDSYVPKSCKTGCADFRFCSGGCRVNALHHCGKLDGFDPWMTEPSSVSSLANKIQNVQVLNPNIDYALSKNIRFRKEKDNFYVAYAGGLNKMSFINSEFLSLLRSLAKYDKFCPDSVIAEHKLERKAFMSVLTYLYTKHFVKEV